MSFNANRILTEQVCSEPWVLFGETVSVTTSYKYLGTEIEHNLQDCKKDFRRPSMEVWTGDRTPPTHCGCSLASHCQTSFGICC